MGNACATLYWFYEKEKGEIRLSILQDPGIPALRKKADKTRMKVWKNAIFKEKITYEYIYTDDLKSFMLEEYGKHINHSLTLELFPNGSFLVIDHRSTSDAHTKKAFTIEFTRYFKGSTVKFISAKPNTAVQYFCICSSYINVGRSGPRKAIKVDEVTKIPINEDMEIFLYEQRGKKHCNYVSCQFDKVIEMVEKIEPEAEEEAAAGIQFQ